MISISLIAIFAPETLLPLTGEDRMFILVHMLKLRHKFSAPDQVRYTVK